MSELERAIAQEEKSPDLAAVARYYLEGLKRALERMGERSRSLVFAEVSRSWCIHCGSDELPCPCLNEE